MNATGTIATYADGSGNYTITREGDTLTIALDNGGGAEVTRYTLTREPDHDWLIASDRLLTDRFAADIDMVWIDGVAYWID